MATRKDFVVMAEEARRLGAGPEVVAVLAKVCRAANTSFNGPLFIATASPKHQRQEALERYRAFFGEFDTKAPTPPGLRVVK